jgi:hypothetical protein
MGQLNSKGQTEKSVETRWWQHDAVGLPVQLAAFFLIVGTLFSKRPELLLHPQFYAEDGRFWYAQAYNLGWIYSLKLPDGGYLNTLPRLFAGISLLFPLWVAPLLMNLAGAAIEALPICALLSARCRNWGSLRLRIVMALVYLLMPRSLELNIVLTNAQWHLVILEILLAFGAPPRRWIGRVSDIVLFAVGSISGPFSILLFPLVLLFWQRSRQVWTPVIATLLGVGASIQLYIFLHFGRQSMGVLGAEPALLLRILGSRIILFSIFRPRALLLAPPSWILILAVILGIVVFGYCLRFGAVPLRLQIVFTFLFLPLALHSPLISGNGTLWQLLLSNDLSRYWYYPMLAFLWSAAWCAFNGRQRVFKVIGVCILLPMFLGVKSGWRYPLAPDEHFALSVQRFKQASPGEHVVIPIYPDNWDMELIKHGHTH